MSETEAMTCVFATGDIFRWRFKSPPDFMSYHCCSQIAVVRDGRLVDTYWGTGSDNKSWSFADARKKLDLEFVANSDDLVKSSEYMSEYFDDADCVNLNHSNSSRYNFFLRKGAAKSRDKMRATAQRRREDAIRDVLSASRQIERMDRALNQIEFDDTLDDISL